MSEENTNWCQSVAGVLIKDNKVLLSNQPLADTSFAVFIIFMIQKGARGAQAAKQALCHPRQRNPPPHFLHN